MLKTEKCVHQFGWLFLVQLVQLNNYHQYLKDFSRSHCHTSSTYLLFSQFNYNLLTVYVLTNTLLMCLEQLILPTAQELAAPLLVAIIKSNFSCTYHISSAAYRASLREGYELVLLFSAFTILLPSSCPGERQLELRRSRVRMGHHPQRRHRNTFSCLHEEGASPCPALSHTKPFSQVWKGVSCSLIWALDPEAFRYLQNAEASFSL